MATMLMKAGCWVIPVAILTCWAGNLSAQEQAARPGAAAEYRPGGYPETYGQPFYPARELQALPPARAQASAAAAEYRRAQSSLTNSIEDIRRSFLHSDDLKKAVAQERASYEAFNAARGKALASLKNDPTYQAAVELRDRLGRQIEAAHKEKNHSPEHLLAMSALKLSYSASVTAMEASATAADSDYAAARDRLVAAGAKLSELREQFEDSVHDSPDVRTARKGLEDARIVMLATNAMYVEATTVANAAMDYAYWLYERPQPYVINTPIYGGGYGYTHGSTNSYPLGYPMGYPIGYPAGWQNTQPRPR